MRLGRLGFLLFCACLAIAASVPATERPSVATGTLEASPTIDGNISESEWSGAAMIDGQLIQFEPDPENDTTWIHVLESVYSFNPDLFIKLFVQSNSAIDKLNVQATWVWRFIPPFGSLQIAYQRGTSEIGEVSKQGNTLFTKLSWVF